MAERDRPKRILSLFDAICIIVGIIVGVGVYETPPLIAQNLSSDAWIYGMWVVGGGLSLIGALCYAELSTLFPHDGGDYYYLSHAFGRRVGFLFGWSRFTVVGPGSIAALAFAFARYLSVFFYEAGLIGEATQNLTGIALSTVAILTGLNYWGLKTGTVVQNVMTVLKAVAIVLVASIVFIVPGGEGVSPAAKPAGDMSAGIALILILFCFGGWNEIAYVAAEVRRPEKNLVRALIWGTLMVTGLFLILNHAYLVALGIDGVRNSKGVASDTLATVLPSTGALLMSGLICISAFSALNGFIFTSARISFVLGQECSALRALGSWHGPSNSPRQAILVQGLLAAFFVLLAGSFLGVVVYTTAVLWLFFLLSGISLFVLRRKFPYRHRPYRVPGYPLTPLIFCSSSLYLAYSALVYDPVGSLVSLLIVLSGMPVWIMSEKNGRAGLKGMQ